jgi:hypothetical protein
MDGIDFVLALTGMAVVLTFVNLVFTHLRRRLELKHETYRKLIEAGQLDRQTLEQIVAGIEGRPVYRPSAEPGNTVVARTSFLFGWLAIFVGVGLWLGGGIARDRDMFTGGVVVGLIGVGLASLPIAWREIQTKFAREAGRRG